MEIEIWSDVACPFCYVGKRHFEAALERFEGKDDVTVTWRSYQLDPNRPLDPEGDVHDLLARKVGGRERAIQMNHQMTAMAAQAGLEYHLDKVIPTNTFDAHRLTHLAAKQGRQDAIVEALFKAYFCDGEHIGKPDTLKRIGADLDGVDTLLESDEYADEVRDDIETAWGFGISGVPTFVINRRFAITGAQPVETIRATLEKVAEQLAST
jgi:predicted DsbA family dithiol-disulfide isomerase